MRTLDAILFLIAAVAFLAATLNAKTRINLVALGLLAWVTVYVVAAFQRLN